LITNDSPTHGKRTSSNAPHKVSLPPFQVA
jgi:hypothetical protein